MDLVDIDATEQVPPAEPMPTAALTLSSARIACAASEGNGGCDEMGWDCNSTSA